MYEYRSQCYLLPLLFLASIVVTCHYLLEQTRVLAGYTMPYPAKATAAIESGSVVFKDMRSMLILISCALGLGCIKAALIAQ